MSPSTISMQKSSRKTVRKSPRKTVRKSPRKTVQRSPRKTVQRSPRKTVQQSSRKTVQLSPRKTVQQSSRKTRKNRISIVHSICDRGEQKGTENLAQYYNRQFSICSNKPNTRYNVQQNECTSNLERSILCLGIRAINMKKYQDSDPGHRHPVQVLQKLIENNIKNALNTDNIFAHGLHAYKTNFNGDFNNIPKFTGTRKRIHK